MDTKKMRTCTHLLPDPGGEVVRECLDEIERLRIGHERYEIVRRMHLQQHLAALELHVRTGKPFDQIIDELRPFVRPAAPPPAPGEG